MKSKKIFLKIFKDIDKRGRIIPSRTSTIKEIENCNYELPPYVRFCNFKSRNLNIDYLKKEFLWYLKGDRFDASITEHAKLWREIMNKDGSFNSNYGQYVFGEQKQFDQIIKLLRERKNSKRASILLLTKDHVSSDTNDVPCTYALNFRIRNNKLNMTVHMRSQDAIYGLGNDIPTFSFIHEMMYNALREFYPDIEYGRYHHFVDSLHVYEKHWPMLEKILDDDEFEEIECPKISGPNEVKFLRELKFDDVPEYFKFTRWLLNK